MATSTPAQASRSVPTNVVDADEYAVLRIRLFRNSGDGYAHSQEEINKKGQTYYEALIDKNNVNIPKASTDYVKFSD